MDPLADIKQTFFQECEEQLGELELGLLAMQEGAHDSETVNAVFRAVHSVKGGAGAFSLEDLVRFAHVFETALDEVRTGRLAPEPDVVAVLLRSADVLADLVSAARDGGSVDAARSAALAEELAALGPGSGAEAAVADDDMDFGFMPVAMAVEPSGADATSVWIVRFRPHSNLYAKANETALLLRELGRLGETETTVDTGGVPLLADLDPEGAYLAWTVRLTGAVDERSIREVFEFVDGDCDLEIRCEDAEPSASDPAAGSDDIAALLARVQAEASPVESAPPQSIPDTPKAAATGAAASRRACAAGRRRHDPRRPRTRRSPDRSGRRTGDQSGGAGAAGDGGRSRAGFRRRHGPRRARATHSRHPGLGVIGRLSGAQPVKSVFQRMPRLVREVGAMTGKPVRLLTEGEGNRARQDRHRTPDRSADPFDPQRHRPWAGKPGEARRGQQARGKAPCVCRPCISLGPDRDRGDRRRRRYRPAACPRDRRKAGPDRTGCSAQRRRDRQPDLHAGLLDRRRCVRHLGTGRGHGRGAAFDPGAGRPHLHRLAAGRGFDLHPAACR